MIGSDGVGDGMLGVGDRMLGNVTQAVVPGSGGGRPAVRDLREAEKRVPGLGQTRPRGGAATMTASIFRRVTHGAGECTADSLHIVNN